MNIVMSYASVNFSSAFPTEGQKGGGFFVFYRHFPLRPTLPLTLGARGFSYDAFSRCNWGRLPSVPEVLSRQAFVRSWPATNDEEAKIKT